MLERIKAFLAPPILEDENQSLSATLLNTVLLVMLGAAIFIPPILLIATPRQGASDPSLLLGWIMAGIIAGVWYVMQRGYVELASYLFSFTFLIVLSLVTFLFGGIRNASTIGFILLVIISILLIRKRVATVLFTSLSIIALTLAYVAEISGLIRALPARVVGVVDFIIYAAVFTLTGSLLHFAVRNLNEAIQRARASERAAAEANRQLHGLNADLENRVAARTQALVTSAEIGRHVSTILEQAQLVKEVADEIRDAFDYYQVHLYLLNETGDTLQLAAGAGHAGAELVARRHTVPVEKGLVGRAVRTNKPVLAPDVTQIESWLPNALLPDTKSEITVPIAQGDKVLGVLDIQENRVDGLGQNDADLLLSISGQVAVALQNARLLAEAEARAEQEALINQISQQIQSTPSIEKAMQVAIREIGRAVNAPQVRVRLGTGGFDVPQNGNETAADAENVAS